MKKDASDASVEELKLAVGLLVRRMRAASPSEQHELSWTQKSVLQRLESEGAMTSADLARAEGVKPQSMSTAIAHLEETGLVERKPRSDDGRQIDIRLTAKAVSMRKAGRTASRTWLSEAIGKLNKGDQATLFEAARIMKKLVEL